MRTIDKTVERLVEECVVEARNGAAWRRILRMNPLTSGLSKGERQIAFYAYMLRRGRMTPEFVLMALSDPARPGARGIRG